MNHDEMWLLARNNREEMGLRSRTFPSARMSVVPVLARNGTTESWLERSI